MNPSHRLPRTRQCTLLELCRSGTYYQSPEVSSAELKLIRLIDEIHTGKPFLGSRRIRDELENRNLVVNCKRIRRLMRILRISAVYQKPNLSKSGKGHKIYPYLLRDVAITRSNQVWATDITYIPMPKGFMYLVAIMGWYSRKVLA